MAFYKLLAQSFIENTLHNEGAIVDINDDPSAGGMSPGDNMAACDADGNLAAAKAAKPKSKKAAPAADAAGDAAGASDLA